MVLSPRAIGYARYALASLFRNAIETVELHLITDSREDQDLLSEEIARNQSPGRHTWRVYAEADCQAQQEALFRRYPHLRLFREGHPCWRKITDPLLLSRAGEEILVLDPDLYFPNRFTFETTLDQGLLLMWQKPNCLGPPVITATALEKRVPLARHVDIGVAQWRAPADLDWLDWLLGKIGANRPGSRRVMHVEAIVWAALAMRLGGGYLAPDRWHCHHRSPSRRLLEKLGVSGRQLLRLEPFFRMKCFHAGGEAKMWLAAAAESAWMESGRTLDQASPVVPFVEMTSQAYARQQRTKRLLRRAGYYRLFPQEWGLETEDTPGEISSMSVSEEGPL